ncbi:ABC transporter substrate-binding protein [Williamsia sp. CHRR-6]|uniref:ABC transporter substrate-binding protein n=1 Tax=Williamsia sp. CHRR-6 TaxID=2835871 RepID=UPI001BD91F4F|nr:ABC transporter substrate-binding protein [Williamsia sp. CHRR-6]MBT0567309.1 ABC transporter substrate-binding protein [Williamsia sp. CHRR-6]
MSRRLHRLRLLAPVLVVLTAVTVASGCGSDSSPGSTSPSRSAGSGSAGSTSFPVTVSASNGPVTLTAAPRAIVSLSPTATEMLFAIDAGTQVKAVDDQSNYPATAPRTKLSGFSPNVEAVAGYAPDLVVASDDIGGLTSGLGKLGIPVVLLPAATSLEQATKQIITLGTLTGHRAKAEEVAADTTRRVDAAVASVADKLAGAKVYHELDQTFYSATSRTFIGSIYKRFGFTNIADVAPTAAGDYPQLSAEAVVRAQPDIVVLADSKCCGQNAATLAARPAFATLPAVVSKRVIVVDDDIASRWGPRVADFAEQVAQPLRGR